MRSERGPDAQERAEAPSPDSANPGAAPRFVLGVVERFGWRAATALSLAAILACSVALTAIFLWALGRPVMPWALAIAALVPLLLATPTLALSLRLVAHLRAVKLQLQGELARRLSLESRLRQLASTDETTGLANRRAFRESAELLIYHARRHGRPVSVLALDLDGFKALNDRFGHATGDRALGAVGLLLRDCLRQSDLAARVGGDEFVVLLPEADPARAHSVAERLRVGVHEAVPGLTVSIGVASEDGSGAALERLLTRADKALYAAKSGGRDRVAVAEPLTAAAPGAGEP